MRSVFGFETLSALVLKTLNILTKTCLTRTCCFWREDTFSYFIVHTPSLKCCWLRGGAYLHLFGRLFLLQRIASADIL